MFLLAQNAAAALYWYRGEVWVVPSNPADPMVRLHAPERRGGAAEFCPVALRSRRAYVLDVLVAEFANRWGAPSFRPPCPLFQAQ